MTDFLILGGGTAGSVLAARLSEDPRHRVTLVEAGRDITAKTMPREIRAGYFAGAHLEARNIWPQLEVRMGAEDGTDPAAVPPRRRYEQARLLGGGSAINAMLANRGAPSDYDEWGARGAKGWTWETCLPYFRKLESDRDFDGPLHGKDGPIPIRRTRAEQFSPFVRAVIRVLDAHGHSLKPDQNGEWLDGTFAAAIAVSDAGERVPTSVAYLMPEVRRRENLRILTGRIAERILFDGTRAIGALVAPAQGGRPETFQAEHVVVASGAIHTPALLMRSGVGAGAALRALGIAVVVDRPGVGLNLMEHPCLAVSAYLRRAARVRDRTAHHEQAILRFSSGLEGTPPGDMHGAIQSHAGWHSVGQRIGSLLFWVNKSYSSGEVRLASADPRTEPAVDFSLLSDWRDLERLKGSLRLGAAVLTAIEMAGVCGPVFPTSHSPRVAHLARPGLMAAIYRGALSVLMDAAGPLRTVLIHGIITDGIPLRHLLDDDEALTAFVRRSVTGTWHASGTCRMGAAGDPLAVCDGSGSVIGTRNLSVCDASLMPTIPRANTNVPTIMIAEKISDCLRYGAQP